MAVKIRLKRLGKMRAPYYRIVVADSRTKRDGRAIEEIGKYHPTEDPSYIQVDGERARYWLGVGAQPSPQVMAILKVTGDWQTFKGEPGGEGTLRMKEPKAVYSGPTATGISAAPAAPAAPAAQKAPEPTATAAPKAAAPEVAAPEAAPAPEAAAPEATAAPDEPQPAEVANAEQPEGADEQAEAGSAGTND